MFKSSIYTADKAEFLSQTKLHNVIASKSIKQVGVFCFQERDY